MKTLACSGHSMIIDRRVLSGMRLVIPSGISSLVIGERACSFSALTIAWRSYVCPSAALTGFLITASVMGHTYWLG